MRKPFFWVSYRVRLRPDCIATEEGLRLEISDLESRGIALSCSENKDAEISAFVFAYMQKNRFSHNTTDLFSKLATSITQGKSCATC